MATTVYAIVPQPLTGQGGTKRRRSPARYPVLYLLHGLSDDHTIWLRRTSIERYATEKGIAVIMPGVARSFYQDMVSGPQYWTFVSEELPRLARHFFPISDRREQSFVAGLSMGGYGAFRMALAHPDRYAAAASFSGVMDLSKRVQEGILSPMEQSGIFGDKPVIKDTDRDLFFLARRLAASGKPVPRLYQYCGDQDFLWQDNLRFRRLARRLHLPLTWKQDGGGHAWRHWDEQIQQVLAWLPL
jgi:S-formylglutathione hydrolase FrmB